MVIPGDARCDSLGEFFEVEGYAHFLEGLLEETARFGVELVFHEVFGEVNDVDLQTPVHQPACGFETEQSAADDDGPSDVRRVVDHLRAVVKSAKCKDAGSERSILGVEAVDWRHEGKAAGREYELVVRHEVSARGVDRLGLPIDADGFDACEERDAVSFVPFERIDVDVLRVVRTRQDTGKEDPVVIAVPFVAEHRYGELLGSALRQDFFDEARTGHPVAHDH